MNKDERREAQIQALRKMKHRISNSIIQLEQENDEFNTKENFETVREYANRLIAIDSDFTKQVTVKAYLKSFDGETIINELMNLEDVFTDEDTIKVGRKFYRVRENEQYDDLLRLVVTEILDK